MDFFFVVLSKLQRVFITYDFMVKEGTQKKVDRDKPNGFSIHKYRYIFFVCILCKLSKQIFRANTMDTKHSKEDDITQEMSIRGGRIGKLIRDCERMS